MKKNQISKIKMLTVASALLAGSIFSSNSYAGKYDLTLGGLLDFYTPSVDTNNPTTLVNSSKLGWGFGGFVESTVMDPIALETGLLFMHRSNEYNYNNAAVKFTQSSNWLQLPVGVKVKLADIVSVGGGAYAAYRLSDISNDYSVGDSTVLSFNTTSQENLEFGLYLAAGLTVPVAPMVGLRLEGRYLRGLTNLSKDSSQNIKSADVIGFAGVQFSY